MQVAVYSYGRLAALRVSEMDCSNRLRGKSKMVMLRERLRSDVESAKHHFINNSRAGIVLVDDLDAIRAERTRTLSYVEGANGIFFGIAREQAWHEIRE